MFFSKLLKQIEVCLPHKKFFLFFKILEKNHRRSPKARKRKKKRPISPRGRKSQVEMTNMRHRKESDSDDDPNADDMFRIAASNRSIKIQPIYRIDEMDTSEGLCLC